MSDQITWNMNHPPTHPPRHIERRDDDTPGAPPWPWAEPASPQARRVECQKLAHLGEVRQ
jgi:hypothetical protein